MDSVTGSSRLKLTCVTATFNVLADGNGEALRRCVASVARLAVPHEHLIYDGASTDGTAELLRRLGGFVEKFRIGADKNLLLSAVESLELYDRRVLPLRVAFCKLAHASPVVRRSARFYLMRGMLDLLGLLDAHGSARGLRRK